MSQDLSSSVFIPGPELALSALPTLAQRWDALPLMLKAEFLYALLPVIERRANGALPPPCHVACALTFADGSVFKVEAPLSSVFGASL